MSLGGLNTDHEMREARRTCAFCEVDFVSNETKTMMDDKYYHPDCYSEYLYKLDDHIHDSHKKEDS